MMVNINYIITLYYSIMLLEICALSKMYRCISKNLNIVKKLFFYNISKSEIFIYSRLITRKVKHVQKNYFIFL